MNRRILTLAAAALLLPIVLRFVWFFPGFVLPHAVAIPDYASLKMPEPPVSTAAAVAVTQAPGTVLIDNAHANAFQLSEIESLTGALTQRAGRFVLSADNDVLDTQLRSANAYVVISPSRPFSPEELAAIQAFVARGGRLLVLTDATRGAVQYDYTGNPVSSQPDAGIVAPLLEPFGIAVNADYLYDLGHNEGNFRNVYLTAPAAGESSLTAGIGTVTFYGAHSLSTLDGTPLLVGGEGTLSSSTDALPEDAAQHGWAAAVLDAQGRVMALGDFTFLAAPYDLVADNQILIAHIADFLLAAREPALADYPYLFRGPSVLLSLAPDLQMTAEMTDSIAGLELGLREAGLNLQLVPFKKGAGDQIVLGTYSSGNDLESYVHPFGLQADDYGEFITLPPFGKLGRSGTGVLLFRSGSSGNTLVLLASSSDDMTSLLDALSGGKLDGCLAQGNVAACSIGFGGSFSESTPTPAPQLTPTASG